MKKIQQFNIVSLRYERIRNSGYEVEESLIEAERNEELIAVADNEVMRAVRRITRHEFLDGGEEKLEGLLRERNRLIRQANSDGSRKRIAEINNAVRGLLYIPEVISVTTRDKRDYAKIGRDGFKFNGERYRRLLCSPAMARTNRAMFCAERIYGELDEALRCGCRSIEIVPAKWNAYYGLTSSAAYEVSRPRVCVVADLEIRMMKRVDWVTDEKHEDTVDEVDKELGFNIWDGMGLICPLMAEKWSFEIGYEGIAESFIVRAPFVKGLLATFDFHRFARDVAGCLEIKDIYGKVHNVDEIDVILTESQFKLWKAYDSMESYQQNMEKYGLSWGVTRVGVPDGKKVMRTNYQFLQVLKMDDGDIEEVCEPTVDWLKGISGGSYESKVIYLLGKIAKSEKVSDVWDRVQDPAIKALMIEPELINDEYLSEKVSRSIEKKVKQTYIGKLLVDGGFNFVYSDPYALAEYCFGMEPSGLLKEFEYYADFWSKKGVNEVVAMRSPLTWRAEVNKLKLKHSEKMQEWYKYIANGVIFNMWGLDRETHSSMDFDGDIIATTNNEVFLRCRYGGVPVLYESQKAKKEFIEK